MVYVYYHIYAIDGVEFIIDEQLSLMETHFNFPYILNIGISVSQDNISISYLLDKFYKYNKPNYRIRDIRFLGNEFVTLDTLEKDSELFGNSDYILYLHTKGASKIHHPFYQNIVDWRNLMQYYNIEKYSNVFDIFSKTEFNTCGVNFHSPAHVDKLAYFGNFWWAKSEYIKTINFDIADKYMRVDAEFEFIQHGKNWKPYSIYDSGINHYYEPYPIEKYKI